MAKPKAKKVEIVRMRKLSLVFTDKPGGEFGVTMQSLDGGPAFPQKAIEDGIATTAEYMVVAALEAIMEHGTITSVKAHKK